MNIKEIIIFYFIAASLVLTAGCSGKGSDEPGVVERVSGGTEIKTYNNTRSKIKDISAEIKKRYEITD